TLVKGTGRWRGSQQTHDRLKKTPDRSQAQPLPGQAEAGAVRCRFPRPEPTAILEDLPDGQIGKQTHGQHDPKDHLACQAAAAAIETAGVQEGLSNILWTDNLLKQEQAVQHMPSFPSRQQTQIGIHPRHSLPDFLVLVKLKLSGGCDLCFVKRYWA